MEVKHIALINLSIISGNKKWYSTKVDINGEKLEFKELAFQTNETALQYFCWKRAKQDSAAIDKVFAFATKKAQDLKCNKKEMENEDCFGKTSLEWLGESMPKYQNSLDINVTYKSFDDWLHIETLDESSVLQALVSLNKMVDAIQDYRKANNEKEIVVHIDLTGGQRYSTVMMMALIQLSKYSGIQIGDAVYSNMDNGEINDVKSLVEMYSLISGSEEFTTFGSVKQIEALFNGKQKSKELTELIVAMKNVSEVFKVCGNKESVNKVLKELKDKIEGYKVFLENNKATDKNGDSVYNVKIDGQEHFFSKLLPTIEGEYSEILNGDIKETIRWCLNRGMLQQALTLYSEWIPECVIGNDDNKLYYTEVLLKDLSNSEKLGWVSDQQFLFKKYTPKDYIRRVCYVGDLKKILGCARENTINEVLSQLENLEECLNTKPVVTGYSEVIKLLKEIQNVSKSIDNNIEETTAISSTDLLKKIFDGRKSLKNWKVWYPTGRKNYREKGFALKALDCIVKTYDSTLSKIFNLPEGCTKSSEIRKDVFEYLFIRKCIYIVGKNQTEEQRIKKQEIILNIVGDYNEIVSDWRNSLNHANAQSDGSNFSHTIEKKIRDSLNDIKELME